MKKAENFLFFLLLFQLDDETKRGRDTVGKDGAIRENKGEKRHPGRAGSGRERKKSKEEDNDDELTREKEMTERKGKRGDGTL